MKEQLSLVNSTVTEIEQLSIKGVIKLYFNYNLVAYFDLFIERRACLCLFLHGHPLFGFKYLKFEIYLKFTVVK